MPLMSQLITAMRKAIDTGRVTVTELADSAGCSRQYIYNLLEGISEPTLTKAEKLAVACGFSLEIRKPKKISKM